jgi:hypothetical protein
LLNLNIVYFFSGNKSCESFKNSISWNITFIKLNSSLIFSENENLFSSNMVT